MKKFNIIFICGFWFFLNLPLIGGELRDKAESVIKKTYSDEIEIKSFRLNFSKDLKIRAQNFSRQRFLSSFVYYYEIRNDSGNVGYAILDNVLGKVKPITFLVIFNTDLSINKVEIIKYREQYGRSVERREWLSQFNDKTVESTIELNSTIDGITGATISVKSVTKGVKRLVYFINNMGENERDLLVSIE